MKPSQVAGIVLWRTGLVIAGGWTLYESWGWVLEAIDLPRQIEVALGLSLTGAVLVLVSLVLERIGDARREREQGGLST